MLQIFPIMLFPDSHKYNQECFGILPIMLWILPEFLHKIRYTYLRTDFKLWHKLLFSIYILLKQIEASVQTSIAGVC